MSKAKRKEGPRAPLFYCAVALVLCGPAFAQTVDVSELEGCAALETNAAKLACFEALVAAHTDAPLSEPDQPVAIRSAPGDREAPPVREAEPLPAEAAPEETAVAAAVAEAAEEPPVASSPVTASAATAPANPEPRPVERQSASEPVVDTLPAPETTTAPEATPAAAVPDSFGRSGRSGPEVVRASVVKVTKDRYGALIFHFENGQVWKQLEKRYFSYPKRREFDVTISEGMMGESRLQVEGVGRKVTIRRIQ